MKLAVSNANAASAHAPNVDVAQPKSKAPRPPGWSMSAIGIVAATAEGESTCKEINALIFSSFRRKPESSLICLPQSQMDPGFRRDDEPAIDQKNRNCTSLPPIGESTASSIR